MDKANAANGCSVLMQSLWGKSASEYLPPGQWVELVDMIIEYHYNICCMMPFSEGKVYGSSHNTCLFAEATK